ncbi:hypothetical protein MLD38_007519 [Melastoma candidum]|uniref:Uncharacterized protein n=1 Tax=Melastoma candidum TaxID=119954 RepID=A0ACB9RRD1_9MYRT|nr:hypothetical protein MLD38_007519 [Melastoma candidum]
MPIPISLEFEMILANQSRKRNLGWEWPSDLREAIASIIFAAPRCSDVPDLFQLKNLFTTKYGKEFCLAAAELRPESGVNRELIEKFSVGAPPAKVRLKVLKDIAQEHNLDWDSSNTEAELRSRKPNMEGYGCCASLSSLKFTCK